MGGGTGGSIVNLRAWQPQQVLPGQEAAALGQWRNKPEEEENLLKPSALTAFSKAEM